MWKLSEEAMWILLNMELKRLLCYLQIFEHFALWLRKTKIPINV